MSGEIHMQAWNNENKETFSSQLEALRFKLTTLKTLRFKLTTLKTYKERFIPSFFYDYTAE